MMRRYQIVVLCFLALICVCELRAQELSRLYSDYLPKGIVVNDEHMDDVSKRLLDYGSVDPHLIYYYLQHLELKFVSGQSDPELNSFNLLRSLYNQALLEKSQWLRGQLSEIENGEYGTFKANELGEHFSRRLLPVNDSIRVILPDSIDRNKLLFFSYIYITRESGLIYDEATDYATLNHTAANEKISGFSSSFLAGALPGREQRNQLIEEAWQYPFLFRDSYHQFFLQTTDFALHQFVAKFMDVQLQSMVRTGLQWQSIVRIGLEYSANDAQVSSQKTNFVYQDGYLPGDEHAFDFVTEFETTLNLAGSLNLTIHETHRRFAYLKFSFGYKNTTPMLVNEEFEKEFYSTEGPLPGGHIWLEYTVDGIEGSNRIMYAQFETPVYYYRQEMWLELGAAFYSQSATWEHIVTRTGELTDLNDVITDLTVSERFEFENTATKIYPSVNWYWRVAGLDLRVGSEFGNATFGVEYTFMKVLNFTLLYHEGLD